MRLQETTRKCKFFVVDLEPAPYKTDLWNAFPDSELFDVFVLYTEAKNLAQDNGHDFQELPPAKFSFTIFSGQGYKSLFRATFTFFSMLFRWSPHFIFISGYVGILPFLSIIACVIFRKNYAVHSDIFNNTPPQSLADYMKQFARNIIRRLIFASCTAVLTCGVRGRNSALIAGCRENKIFDFPYVVDTRRILSDEPRNIPDVCRQDIVSGSVIIFFSGRMIQRKGLITLIRAVSELTDMSSWILWIEGDGPLLENYISEVHDFGLNDRCRFLGFCQMSLHSWLLRNSDIVVVPSLRDSWGIVVDEGMQLGKAVVASDGTGSGADRILNDSNGLIFTAGNHHELSDHLRILLINPQKRVTLGNLARITGVKFGPKVNVYTISEIIKFDHSV